MLIFVTGKSGSGKSTFAKILADKLNYAHIDVDKIGLEVYEFNEVMEQAERLFGNAIFDNDGTFNRKKLGEIVFAERNSARVKKFRNLTWKYMKRLMKKQIKDNAVIEYILLPETPFWKLNSIKILLKATSDETRKQNIIKRDNISREYAEQRDKASIEYNNLDFNFIFENNYNMKYLEECVLGVVNYIKEQNYI